MRSTTVFYLLFFCVSLVYKIYILSLTLLSFFLFFSAGCIWSLTILSCHHSGTFTPTLFHILLLYHSSLCCYTTSSPATFVNNLTIQSPFGIPSQGPQVVARAGLLSHELAHLSLSWVPGHQAGQETFGPGGDALTLTSATHVLRAGPRGPGGLAPG